MHTRTIKVKISANGIGLKKEECAMECIPLPESKALTVYRRVVTAAHAAIEGKEDARLKDLRKALREYHSALDNHRHRGVAASQLVEAVQQILETPWVQGATLPKNNESKR